MDKLDTCEMKKEKSKIEQEEPHATQYRYDELSANLNRNSPEKTAHERTPVLGTNG